MTEEEARAWLATRFPAAVPTLERLATMVAEENGRQNLVAPSTLPLIWSRHVADSLQLVPLAEGAPEGAWLDVGTGGGFPGLAVAAAVERPVVLVEPRRRRAEFLLAAAGALGLGHVVVRQARVEAVSDRAAIVSARAVAGVTDLVEAAGHVALAGARWLLPRGRVDEQELAALKQRGFVFHVEQSVTATDSAILILERAS